MRLLAVLLLTVVTSLLAPAAGSTASPARSFAGRVTIDPSFAIAPEDATLLARPAGREKPVCGRGLVDEETSYTLALEPGRPLCRGEIWFWLRAGGRELRFAESARFEGPARRRLNLHLWAPMRLSGTVLSPFAAGEAAVVVCAGPCRPRPRLFCGGGPVLRRTTFALVIRPRAPDARCPRDGDPAGVALLTADGRLYHARLVRYRSGGAERIDVVAGFRRRSGITTVLSGLPRVVRRGSSHMLTLTAYLGRTEPEMDFLVEASGPAGVSIRALDASDPLPRDHPLHNTWLCTLEPQLDGAGSHPAGHCASFIGQATPGKYLFYVDLRSPSRRGWLTLRLHAAAGDAYAWRTVRVRVR